jgi:hypothetical protein
MIWIAAAVRSAGSGNVPASESIDGTQRTTSTRKSATVTCGRLAL